jgi:predicted DNA-binding ribbon-helix-helix protein
MREARGRTINTCMSTIIRRSVSYNGKKTSVSLEDAFWDGFQEIARTRGLHVSAVMREIVLTKDHANLSSAIRLFVLSHYVSQSRHNSEAALAASRDA